MSVSINLIFNLSLLVAISVISAIIEDKTVRRNFPGQIFQGLLFGGAAVVGILYPVVLAPGVIFDGRSVVLSLCGLFFGPWAGSIAAIMAIFTRVLVGGGGILMGVLVITSALLIGLFFHFKWKVNLARMTYWKLYLVGILVHVVMIGLMFTLPADIALTAIRRISVPVLLFYPIATVVMGKILKDNIDRIQTREDLLLQKEKAEQSNRLKDAFIASISHEIRTPLNAILGFISIIEDEASDRFSKEEQVYFQRINQSGQRLTRTVDEILNYSRLLVKDVNLYAVRIELSGLITGLIEESKAAHMNHRAEILFENSVGTQTVFLDDFCIRNSISNLLDNALKYTETGSVTVGMHHNAEGRVCISIADTGIGMSEEFLSKIFEPYSQEATGFSRRYEGVGLGLSIVKQLCDMMGAEISVTSTKGIGSTFTIRLPGNAA